MNPKILLYALLISFAGCTTAYQSSQTPDDVYYSPAQPLEENRYERPDENTAKESAEDKKVKWSRKRYDRDYDRGYSGSYGTYIYHPKGYYYYYDPKTKSQVTYYPRKFNFNKPSTSSDTYNPKTGQPAPGNNPVRTIKSSSGLGNFLRQVLKATPSVPTRSNEGSSSTPVRTFDNSNSNSGSDAKSGSSNSSSPSNGSVPVRTFK